MTRFISLLAALLLTLLPSESLARQDAPDINPELAERLQTILNEERSRQALQGISASVHIPEQGVWTGVSGRSGQMPPDTIRLDTRFAVASITKLFTAALVLQLAEEGQLSLQDSLHHWLPAYHYINPNVTLDQLLRHRSGIYNFTDNTAFWNALWADPQREWMPEEIVENFLQQPAFNPGSRLEYSNTNYTLLGMIASAVTGASVSEQFRNRFFTPLGLNDTFYAAEEVVTGDVAHNWSDTNRDGQVEDLSPKTGLSMYSMVGAAGGIVSTSADMVRWAEALYSGQVIDTASLADMLEFTPVSYNAYWTGYGQGTMRFNFEGEELWGHTGLLPGYRSILAYSPSTGVSISVFVNQDDFASVYTIGPLLFKTVRDFEPLSTSSEWNGGLPATINLHQNYPNPFNHTTVIAFDLPASSSILIEVYDLRGKKVATVADAHFDGGAHRITWNAAGLPSGLYLYRLTAGTHTSTRSLLYVN